MKRRVFLSGAAAATFLTLTRSEAQAHHRDDHGGGGDGGGGGGGRKPGKSTSTTTEPQETTTITAEPTPTTTEPPPDTTTTTTEPPREGVVQLSEDPNEDQAPALLAAIAAAPDGTAGHPTIISLPSGRFRMDQAVRTRGRAHLRIRGPEDGSFVSYSHLTSADLEIQAGRQHFTIDDCVDVVGQYLNVVGPNDERHDSPANFPVYYSSLAFDHAFAIRRGSDQCGWENCTFDSVYGDGFYVGSARSTDNRPNTNIFIKDCWGTHCARQCFGITCVDGLLIDNVEVVFGGRSGIDLEPNRYDDICYNVVCDNVRISSRYYSFLATQPWNTPACRFKNIEFRNCTTLGVPSNHAAIHVTAGEHVEGFLRIINHTDLRHSSAWGINLGAAWPDVLIENCHIHTSRSGDTHLVRYSRGGGSLIVRNNEATGFAHLIDWRNDSTPELMDVFEACGNTLLGDKDDACI